MRQRNATNAFAFDFLSGNRQVGGFDFAVWSQAQNARLKHYKKSSTQGDVVVTLGTSTYRMIHTYTERAFLTDVLYQLVTDASNDEAARIDLIRVKGRRWPDLFYTPGNQERMRTGIEENLFRRQFSVRRATDQFEVAHTTDTSSIFSLRRQVEIETSGSTLPQIALLGVFLSFFRP